MARPRPRWFLLPLGLWLVGCTGLPSVQGSRWDWTPSQSGNSYLDYFLDARARDGTGREVLWQQQLRDPSDGGAADELRLGLLQSLEGHSGYDVVAADRRLRKLRARQPPSEIDAVARLRLAELAENRNWRKQAEASDRELVELKSRLARLVDIERGSAKR